MSLAIGTQLGSYQIVALLGQGGMGEVYRGRDTKLKRDVALKILPDVFSRDPERVGRFQREAEALASLNHPNVAAIYDFQESDGIRFLILELVEGETLAERIRRGALPADEAFGVAKQICEGFEAAHEKGIIHRDLKPANVKITPEGKIKVLDFGLAKALESSPANANISNSPTLSLAGTNAGVIVGTAAYMSPEQARGSPADVRSDIFSLGCVLYEMLTGRQPFQGDTVSDVLASVLKSDPDFSLLPTKLNPRTHELLRRSIEKSPKRRWHAVADLRMEIESILADPQGLVVKEQRARAPRRLWKYAVSLVATAILASVITGVWNSRSSIPLTVTRFSIPLAKDEAFTNIGLPVVAISPDGTQVVYAANGRLLLRSMSEISARPIQGTQSANGIFNPVFSPDGQSVAYFSIQDSTLKRIPVTGGAPTTIAAAGPPWGMSWYDHWLIFGQNAGGSPSIMRVSVNGGTAESLVTLKVGEVAYGNEMLPGGEALLFSVATAAGTDRWDKARIVVQSLASGERKTLIEGGADARYVPTGHLVYALGGTLRAVPFDLRRLEVKGAPVPILEGVLRAPTTQTAAAHFSFSTTGSLVYVPGPAFAGGNQNSIGLIDRNGSFKPLSLAPGAYVAPRISPDGRKVAFGTDDGKEAIIWIYELSGATSLRRLTFGGSNRFPIWTRDGERITFQSDREGDRGIFQQRADGTGVAERLTKAEDKTTHVPDSWSPDGQKLLFSVERQNGDGDVWILSIPDKKTTPLAQIPQSFQGRSIFSTDGRWFAYQSNESGVYGIFVQPYPTTGAKYQLLKTTAVAAGPLWSPDTRQLFYLDQLPGPGRISAVSVTTQPSLVFGNPMPLPVDRFIQLPPPGNPRNYDITPDGKQFVLIVDPARTQSDTQPSPEIQVVLNWFSELQQRVPVK